MTDTNLVHELQVVADYLRYKYRYTFADACVKAADEIERLRAIVDKLPMTADGVTTALDMPVYFILIDEVVNDVVKNISLSSTGGAFIYLRTYTVKSPVQLYSTREAAKAAKEKNQ